MAILPHFIAHPASCREAAWSAKGNWYLMQMKQDNLLKVQFLLTSVIVLVLALFFSAALHVNHFKKLFVESRVSFFSLLGEDIKRNLEGALRFGKPIDKLWGVDKIIQKPMEYSQDLENVTVSSPGGQVLYSLKETTIGSELEKKISGLKLTDSTTQSGLSPDSGLSGKREMSLHSFFHEGLYHVLLPVLHQNEIVARIDLVFPEELINRKIDRIFKWDLTLIGIQAVISTVLLALMLVFFFHLDMPFKKLKLRIYVILFLIVGGTQVANAVATSNYFKSTYIEATKATVTTLAGMLGHDIEKLLSKGISIDRLVNIDSVLENIISATPEVDDIRIMDAEHKTLYLANSQGTFSPESPQKAKVSDPPGDGDQETHTIRTPLQRNGDLQGTIVIRLSKSFISSRTRELTLNSLTVLVISIILVSELVIFLLIFLNRQIKSLVLSLKSKVPLPPDVSAASKKDRGQRDYSGAIRPAAFLYLFAVSLSLSFVPLYMGDLIERAAVPIPWLSKNIFLGLPISVEMFLAAIGIIIGGRHSDKFGWQRIFFAGTIISSIGAVASALALGPGYFIMSRGIAGFGYGLTWMAFQCFIFANTDPNEKALVLATLTAGLFSGTLCGSAAGGMLADIFGFSPVFYVIAGMLSLPLVFAMLFLREFFHVPTSEEITRKKKTPAALVLKYVTNRNIFSLVLFASIPAAICFTGFLYYAVPIYLKSIGYTQSNIARLIMIYGLMMIFLAPPINKLVDRLGKRKVFISIGGFLGGLGMVVFYLFDGFWAATAAVILLGISSSVGLAAQTIFALDIPIARHIGEGTAIGTYRFLQRMGQVLGPLSLGVFFSSMGIKKGISAMGIVYLCAILLFIILATERKKRSAPGVVSGS